MNHHMLIPHADWERAGDLVSRLKAEHPGGDWTRAGVIRMALARGWAPLQDRFLQPELPLPGSLPSGNDGAT